MSDLAKTPTSTARIRFQDCDPFNHLNNGRYVDYFLNAREDHLLGHYDMDMYTIARTTGRAWVVSESHIAYLRPADLSEEVLISSQLIAYGTKHVQVEMMMWDKQRKVLKSLCWMSFVHFDLKTNRPMEHSPDYMQLFEKVVLPVEEKEFGGRVKGVRQ
jgi:acyl-CoA thioester hydrolase